MSEARREAGPVRGESGGLYTQGVYHEEAMAFLKERMGEEVFQFVMSHEDARRHPYVAAKIYLSAGDWEKYVWIEHHGSLEDYAAHGPA